MSAIEGKETYYRIYYKKDGYIYYTDGYLDKERALEVYCAYIERYSEVAMVKIVEDTKIVLGSLGD